MSSEAELMQEFIDKTEQQKGEYDEAFYAKIVALVTELEDHLKEDNYGATFVTARMLHSVADNLTEHATQVWRTQETAQKLREALQQGESKLQEVK